MAAEPVCAECGAPLPDNAPGNRCPKCLLQLALEETGNADQPGKSSQPADAAADEKAGAQSGSDPVQERIGTMIDRYRLLQQIGEGGFGIVFMAEQTEPVQRKVALKVIKAGMDTREIIARFEVERQALALMDHPNIARVLDGGTTNSRRPYFVMELVRGIPITEYCDQVNFSTRERLELFIKVCRAVQHAHQKGVIHRDIKPTNVLVTLHDGEPVPKVIDFGVAKALGQKLTEKTLFTRFEQMIGTPAYMSPEQAALGGLDIDTRSDIYSLGVLLYELLTGVTPLDAETLRKSALDEIRRMIRETEPPKPSTRWTQLQAVAHFATSDQSKIQNPKSKIPPDLDWITMKCLDKDRQRRYETVNGLARDIERYLNHESVLARPPGRLYGFQKFVRRNKVIVGAGAITATVLTLGVAVSTWQAIRATRAEHAAQKAQAREVEQRQRAEAGEKLASQSLYAAQMDLAQQAWEQNNLARLRQLLQESAEYPQRAFEWYYWQRQTHLELLSLRGHTDVIRSVAFSPDGRRIVTGSWDRTAKVWDAATGKELLTLKGHPSGISSASFSPDGLRIVTGSDDQTVKVWDATTGVELLTLRGHRGWVRSATFSHDGQRIATGSDDQTAKVWDVTTGKELFTLTGHKGEVRSVAFSPNDRRILTGSQDHSAKVWDATTGKELLTLSGHKGEIKSVAFSPNGERIITGSNDQTAKIWDADRGEELVSLKGGSFAVSAVAFSPDGKWIVTGSEDQTASVWESSSGKQLFILKGHNAAIKCVGFSPDGRRIVTGSDDCTVKVWQASGSRDNTTKLWDTASGRELLNVKANPSEISSVAFSPHNQRIFMQTDDKTSKALAALNRKWHGGMVSALALSPDGHWLVTGAGESTAKVWDATTGKELLALKGHNRAIRCGTFSPDGRRIVTGSDDQTAKVWDAASGRELLTLKGQSATICVVAFSPDGHRVVTGSEDQTAKLWEAATPQEVNAWQEEERRAADRLAVLRGEQGALDEQDWTAPEQDPAAIKHWLVLAPIAYQGPSGSAALEQEQIPQEANLHPSAGERVEVDQKERVWKEVQLQHYGIDFNQLLGEQTERSVAYAVCYIQSEFARSDVLMKIGSDDEAKVYLNGKEIYRREESRNYVADQDVVGGVEFKEGLNLLVFKVVNEALYWKGSIRFTDALGRRLNGISVTTKWR